MPFICNYMALDSDGHHSVNMGVQMMAPGGGAVFGVVLATVSCFAIDRKFEESAEVSLVAAILSVRGIFGAHNDLVDLTNGVRGPEHQTIGVYDARADANNGRVPGSSRGRSAPRFSRVSGSGNPRAQIRRSAAPRTTTRDPYDTKAAAPTVEILEIEARKGEHPDGSEREGTRRVAKVGEEDDRSVAKREMISKTLRPRAPIARASEVCNCIIRVLRVQGFGRRSKRARDLNEKVVERGEAVIVESAVSLMMNADHPPGAASATTHLHRRWTKPGGFGSPRRRESRSRAGRCDKRKDTRRIERGRSKGASKKEVYKAPDQGACPAFATESRPRHHTSLARPRVRDARLT